MKTKYLDYKKHFEDKRITKQGFGFLGRGANVVKFLLESGASVLVTDMKSGVGLEKSVKEVEEFIVKNNIDKNKIEYRLGEHRLEDFVNCDYVIQASGVAKDNKFLLYAKENDIPVYQEGSLFCDIVREFNSNLEYFKEKIKIIGVTGTRGKTTTTFLIKAIIDKFLEKENAGGGPRKAYFGGNVQGVATLENLKYLKAGDVVVMELDSWVLQGFGDIKYSPNISVFTTFMPDHMNYYKGSMQEYFLDKAKIFINQKNENIFVSTENIQIQIEKYLEDEDKKNFYNLENKKIYLNQKDFYYYNQKYKSHMLGEHNIINMALGVRACEEFGVDSETIQEVLNAFTGVTGRLELVKEVGGVKYYNDTTATTPDALMVALESLKDEKINLICGGRDKELDMTEAAKKIIDFKNRNIIKNVFLLSDAATTGTQKLLEIFKENNFTDFIECENISIAVKNSKENSDSGEVILFSPGFASFGMFQNEYDRGERYIEELNKIF